MTVLQCTRSYFDPFGFLRWIPIPGKSNNAQVVRATKWSQDGQDVPSLPRVVHVWSWPLEVTESGWEVFTGPWRPDRAHDDGQDVPSLPRVVHVWSWPLEVTESGWEVFTGPWRPDRAHDDMR